MRINPVCTPQKNLSIKVYSAVYMHENRTHFLSALNGFLIGVLVTGAVGGLFLYSAKRASAANAASPSPTTSVVAPAPTPQPTPTPAPAAATASAPPQAPLLLSGAVISQIGSRSLIVNLNRTYYTVNTTSATTYLDANGNPDNFSGLSINDSADIYGTFTASSHSVIAVSKIIDNSVSKSFITSTVASVNIPANTLTITNPSFSNLSLTVSISPSTNITDRNGTLTYLPNINTGDTITVFGLWDRSTGTVTQVSSLTDMNISA